MDPGDATIEILTGTAFMMNGVVGLALAGIGIAPCGWLFAGLLLVTWGILKAYQVSRLQMNLPPPYPPSPMRTHLGPPGWLSGKVCASCGSNNPPNARFCAACAAPF